MVLGMTNRGDFGYFFFAALRFGFILTLQFSLHHVQSSVLRHSRSRIR